MLMNILAQIDERYNWDGGIVASMFFFAWIYKEHILYFSQLYVRLKTIFVKIIMMLRLHSVIEIYFVNEIFLKKGQKK